MEMKGSSGSGSVNRPSPGGGVIREENELCAHVTVLMSAIQWSSYKRVKGLLDNFSKNNLNTESILNTSCGPMLVYPLQLAANISDHTNAIKIVQLLLKKGAKVNEVYLYIVVVSLQK